MGTVCADVVLRAKHGDSVIISESNTPGKDEEDDGLLRTEFHVTGFSRFHSVATNPTEGLVRGLGSYLKSSPLPKGASLSHASVLKVAASTASSALETLYTRVRSYSKGRKRNIRHVVVHFGVNVSVKKFCIEVRARNEATFLCPDEENWAPIKRKIVEDGDLNTIRETTLNASALVDKLREQNWDVDMSLDAGRFVCNWVYYSSLGLARDTGAVALFVHVPPESVISIERQIEFARALFTAISEIPDL